MKPRLLGWIERKFDVLSSITFILGRNTIAIIESRIDGPYEKVLKKYSITPSFSATVSPAQRSNSWANPKTAANSFIGEMGSTNTKANKNRTVTIAGEYYN
jgi:hypothetical protein